MTDTQNISSLTLLGILQTALDVVASFTQQVCHGRDGPIQYQHVDKNYTACKGKLSFQHGPYLRLKLDNLYNKPRQHLGSLAQKNMSPSYMPPIWLFWTCVEQELLTLEVWCRKMLIYSIRSFNWALLFVYCGFRVQQLPRSLCSNEP